ncbi:MAG: shikimate kinase [Deltaproteobacteria bacterium]|nr:MAG: shikimate kinase [Deltaproteobacteria bacterium]
MKYLLCGFMGSGKSTLLEKFKIKSEGYKFYDLDDEILHLHGQDFETLGEFIEARGFDHFRRMETETLESFLGKDEPMVMALGGGAISGVNLSKIKQSEQAKLVFLDTPFEVCFERISGDANRPLVKLGKEKLLELYQERLALYKCADIQIKTEMMETLTSPSQLEEC